MSVATDLLNAIALLLLSIAWNFISIASMILAFNLMVWMFRRVPDIMDAMDRFLSRAGRGKL